MHNHFLCPTCLLNQLAVPAKPLVESGEAEMDPAGAAV